MFSTFTVALLVALVKSEPVLPEAHDDMFATLMTAKKTLDAAPQHRRLEVTDAKDCALEVSGGTADLLDVGLEMWKSVRKCKAADKECAEDPTGQSCTDKNLRCVVEVGGVVSTLTGVGGYILSAMESCGGVSEAKISDECSRSSLTLAGAIADSAAYSTDLSSGCGADQIKSEKKDLIDGTDKDKAYCIMDVKDSMQGLMEVIMELMDIKRKCNASPERCASNAANIVGSVANMGTYVVNLAGDCGGSLPPGAACGSALAGLLGSLATITGSARDVENACKADDRKLTAPLTSDQAHVMAEVKAKLANNARLYQQSKVAKVSDSPFPTTTLLAGCVPLMLIAGFLGGMRYRVGVEGNKDMRSVAMSDNE